MNQRVHLFMRGCLTLKLFLSWKTVICSSAEPFGPLFSPWLFDPSGEIGIVERSTCEVESVADAEATAVAMIVMWDG